jgi:4-hydroxy-2-oxoheptanedioate aldolase
MRGHNRLRQQLANGEVVFGACAQIPSPELVEILGLVGYDFTMIDVEHGLFDLPTAGDLIRAAQGVDLVPLVRVPSNDPVAILKALDMGAQGVIVPHIQTGEDAARAVAASKYGAGGRGACPLVRAARYGLQEWAEYEDQANRETLVIVLIEDLEGARRIDEILSVEGVDVVFLGPFDMAVGSGCRGDVQHATVQAALDRILDACNAKRVPVMHTVTCGPDIEAWIRRGVRLIMQSADSVVFARAQQAFIASVAHLRGKPVSDGVAMGAVPEAQ